MYILLYTGDAVYIVLYVYFCILYNTCIMYCATLPLASGMFDPLSGFALRAPHSRTYGRQASTLACGASSLWRAPTTRWRAIVTSYPGVLLRERTSDGGGAVARAHRLSCGRPRAAEGLEVGGWARLSAGLLGAF